MRRFAFPLALAVIVVTLGSLRISGSSASLYATDIGVPDASAGMIEGPARRIRSDEWAVRTPWILRQIELGLPAEVTSAVGRHDVGVLGDLPVHSWQTILRPHTAVYLFLDAERAFATEWWLLAAVQLGGVYALLLAVTGRVAISALSASMLTLSPATQWWWQPMTFTTIGYGSLAAALFLWASRARGVPSRSVLAVGAGVIGAAFLTALYVPWQLGTALTVAPVMAATLIRDLRATPGQGASIRALAGAAAVTAVIAGLLFGAFAVEHRHTMATIAGSEYPGRAPAQEGGHAVPAALFGAALDFFSSRDPFVVVNDGNQSENSSALPLVIPVAIAAVWLVRREGWRRMPPIEAWALLGVLAAAAVMLAWMLLPVPASAGRLLLLHRVESDRLYLPLGFAGVLAIGLLAGERYRTGCRLPGAGAALAALAFATPQIFAATQYTVNGARVPLGLSLAFIAAATIAVALVLAHPRPLAGMVPLVLFTLAQAALVNPLQRGLGPLAESGLRLAVESVRHRTPEDAGWVVFGFEARLKGTLTAAGVNHLSGTAPYADARAWRRIDPSASEEKEWNRFAQINFVAAPEGAPTTLRHTEVDQLVVTVDPCSPDLDALGVRFIVTTNADVAACARQVARFEHAQGFDAIYERVSAGP